MKKVKIIHEKDCFYLEKEINSFIETHDVVDIQFGATENEYFYSFTTMIVYEE